jgi:hypothetical protein
MIKQLHAEILARDGNGKNINWRSLSTLAR